jgi:hypothetical protein
MRSLMNLTEHAPSVMTALITTLGRAFESGTVLNILSEGAGASLDMFSPLRRRFPHPGRFCRVTGLARLLRACRRLRPSMA